MSKVEELAEKAYPVGDTKLSDAAPSMCRNAFIEGYHQAEKYLELSWEDIELIVNIDKDTDNEESIIGVRKNEEHYQEVLKRFKDFKERKEK